MTHYTLLAIMPLLAFSWFYQSIISLIQLFSECDASFPSVADPFQSHHPPLSPDASRYHAPALRWTSVFIPLKGTPSQIIFESFDWSPQTFRCLGGLMAGGAEKQCHKPDSQPKRSYLKVLLPPRAIQILKHS